MKSIFDLTKDDLKTWLKEQGEKPFRTSQVFEWLYTHKVKRFEDMSNLSKATRELFEKNFTINLPDVVRSEKAPDGTIKFLSQLSDGEEIESVILAHNDHFTLCLSTQVGCAMGCKFCLTSKMGLKRNLTSGEIVAQLMTANEFVGEGKRVRNIVYMGMGEPFHNYENVIKSLQIFTDQEGLRISNRRITVSTSGLIEEIEMFGQEERTKANLAISLNGVREESRAAIMPVTRKHSLERLIEACRNYPLESQQRITFEYVLLRGLTDDMKDAKALVKLLHGTKSKVNLIPFNEHDELSTFKSPEPAQVLEFQRYLLKHGLMATLRTPRGNGISAACGQLATKNKKKNEQTTI